MVQAYERNRHYLRKYGLTAAQREAMFIAQGSCCAVCKTDTSGNKRGWHTDHDHVTGLVRGILCQGCNVALHHRQTPATLRALADYLEKHQ